MPLIEYRSFNFSPATLDIIEKSNRIIAEYQEQGFRLTLRQVYYQLVARDLFPDDRLWSNVGNNKWVRDPKNGSKNAEPNYKWLGTILNDGRMAGMIDWDSIEDRTRSLEALPHWSSPKDIIDTVSEAFAHDKWNSQPNRVEIWVEKEALAGVVGRIAEELDVPFFCCRGYTSQSSMWEGSQRFIRYLRQGQHPHVIHLGDHDPSGIDMSRDVEERLNMFVQSHDRHGDGWRVGFYRIALNRDQVRHYNPPPNPTKLTDSRCRGYIAEHGRQCWELDALEPTVIFALVRSAVEALRDDYEWAKAVKREQKDQTLLKATAKNWDLIAKQLGKKKSK